VEVVIGCPDEDGQPHPGPTFNETHGRTRRLVFAGKLYTLASE
jgi:hypothetical protein